MKFKRVFRLNYSFPLSVQTGQVNERGSIEILNEGVALLAF